MLLLPPHLLLRVRSVLLTVLLMQLLLPRLLPMLLLLLLLLLLPPPLLVKVGSVLQDSPDPVETQCV